MQFVFGSGKLGWPNVRDERRKSHLFKHRRCYLAAACLITSTSVEEHDAFPGP